MARNSSYHRWLIIGGAALLVLPLLFYLLVAGQVTGREFSPDDFSRRDFSYNAMPWFHFPLRGIEYRDDTPVFEQILLADGYLGKPSPKQQWHLVSDSRSNPRSADFDARFLCRYLDLKDQSGECLWIEWNSQHPALAREFWPIIADLARAYLYLDIARIMQQAISISEETIPQFRKLLVETASSAFVLRANELRDTGKYREAISLYGKAIEIRPSREALLARADCHRQLGNQSLSDIDLELAKATENTDDPTDREQHAADLSGQ